ncbi:hypothetical protein NUM_10490 [Actinocatenispora comari]|uniref:Uncharacterized protein n=1 Tax=Actinocatenispora comari TaxID=2807577 RepID=A0A8J4EJ94_9ACTN|nr:hypothetical protein NUM_10490 [Actinocatenispora comari]
MRVRNAAEVVAGTVGTWAVPPIVAARPAGGWYGGRNRPVAWLHGIPTRVGW